jgi:hypothetical protein
MANPPGAVTSATKAKIKQCAILRAGGKAWKQIGEAVNLSEDRARHYVSRYSDLWTMYYTEAVSDVLDEAYAEAMVTARGLLSSDDDGVKQRASDSILRHRAAIAPTISKVELNDVTDRRIEDLSDEELRERAYRGTALRAV